MHGIPDQMSDPAAEMQKKGEGGSKQRDPADPGRDGCLHRSIGLRSQRSRNQPNDQDNGTGAQKYPGDPIEDRENRRELRADRSVRSEDSGLGRVVVGLGIIRLFLRNQLRRSIIIFLISAIALPGLRPFGQVRVQFKIVWQR